MRVYLTGFLMTILLLASGNEAEAKLRKARRAQKDPILIAVLDTGSGNSHEAKVVKQLKAELRRCFACKILTFPIYEKDGTLKIEKVLEQLKEASKQASLLHLSWNIPASPETQKIEDLLRELKKKNIIIVGAAGAPAKPQLSRPLNESVLGRSAAVYIVGEADKKGNLVSNSYYGPEMYLKIEPQWGLKGSSFSSLKLTALVARNWKKKTPEQWRLFLDQSKPQKLTDLKID